MCNIIFAMYDMHLKRYGNRKLSAGFFFLMDGFNAVMSTC